MKQGQVDIEHCNSVGQACFDVVFNTALTSPLTLPDIHLAEMLLTLSKRMATIIRENHHNVRSP